MKKNKSSFCLLAYIVKAQVAYGYHNIKVPIVKHGQFYKLCCKCGTQNGSNIRAVNERKYTYLYLHITDSVAGKRAYMTCSS